MSEREGRPPVWSQDTTDADATTWATDTAEMSPTDGGSPQACPRPTPGLTGTRVAHFELLERLGVGGFGEVYLARDTRLGRMVAVKVLPEPFALDAERRERFRREAVAASALNHRGICTVHDLVEADGHILIVMELCGGETLHAALSHGPFSAKDTVRIAIEVAEALAEAHRAGILHRDIKCGNIALSACGQVKILDFGLAKLVAQEVQTDGAGVADSVTRDGASPGTPGYMSPERLLGKAADRRSDLFSLGVVLYRMVTGRLPFEGRSKAALANAVLHDEPRDFGATAVPGRLKQVILRLLEKDPEKRYGCAEEVLRDLRALAASLAPGRPEGPSRAARVAVLVGGVVAVALGGLLWQRWSRERWALRATAEVARLVDAEELTKAAALAREARTILPRDPSLEKLWMRATGEATVESVPAGADVAVRPFAGDPARWESLGRTPLRKVRLPRDTYVFRISKPGFAAVHLIGRASFERSVRLVPEQSVPPGMLPVPVPGGKVALALPGLSHLPPVALGDFLLDRTEVTNEEYTRFVAAGGYERSELWSQPFLEDGRELPWREAVDRFRDTTGRPGPATWELGRFPKGLGKHPVAGVSWYEAAAYAAFAGKSLPTIYHWSVAAQAWASSFVAPRGNFQEGGTRAVGGKDAVSGSGTVDMAGNVKEWCSNEAAGGRRFLLGGGFGEAAPMFYDPDAQSPWARLPNYGLRCVQLAAPPSSEAAGKVVVVPRDFSKEAPVSDEVYQAFKGLYAYDRAELNARVEERLTTDEWTREKVSFDAAYGSERVIAYLFLPKRSTPPFQVVVHFPDDDAIQLERFPEGPLHGDLFATRSGRALVYPVYKGTYERRDSLSSDIPEPTAFYRDHLIAWSKDLGRTLDYLETRKDLDREKLAYFAFCWGGQVAPALLAVETRFKAAILEGAGFIHTRALPEADQVNFASRVRVPVLMLNGRYDFLYPVETAQLPLFRLLGTPASDKRHVVYDSGHMPPRKDVVRESLDWLDRYLGPVTR